MTASHSDKPDPGDAPSRRKRPRYAVDIKVEMFTKGLEHWVAEKAANISNGGLFVCTEYECEHGDRLHLRIYFQDRDAFFDVKARVIWNCHGEDGHPKGLGVEFVELSDTQKRVIDQVLSQYTNVRPD